MSLYERMRASFNQRRLKRETKYKLKASIKGCIKDFGLHFKNHRSLWSVHVYGAGVMGSGGECHHFEF